MYLGLNDDPTPDGVGVDVVPASLTLFQPVSFDLFPALLFTGIAWSEERHCALRHHPAEDGVSMAPYLQDIGRRDPGDQEGRWSFAPERWQHIQH